MDNQKAKKIEKALWEIKQLFDAWYDNKISIEGNDKKVDWSKSEYNIDSIMGTLGNSVYAGYNLDTPIPKYIKERRE